MAVTQVQNEIVALPCCNVRLDAPSRIWKRRTEGPIARRTGTFWPELFFMSFKRHAIIVPDLCNHRRARKHGTTVGHQSAWNKEFPNKARGSPEAAQTM
jgi:hypothetical protein